MNAQHLHTAADKLNAEASERRDWAAQADNPYSSALYLELAQEIQDRADQTRSWAASAAYYEAREEHVPEEVAIRVERSVKSFLELAGINVDDA